MVSAEPLLSDVPAQYGESTPLAGPSPKKARLEPPATSAIVNWDVHLTKEAKLRTQPTLRKLVTGSAGKPGLVGLHGGLPHPSIFPLEGITLNLKGGATLTIDDPQTVRIRHRHGDGGPCLATFGFVAVLCHKMDSKVLLEHEGVLLCTVQALQTPAAVAETSKQCGS